ncbi:MAG: hypothetical protein AAF357_04400, partial [Verrucomicrobiota bacterium]
CLLSNQSRFTGLAIEFHDIPENYDEIVTFIESFDQTLIHFHPNNFGKVTSEGIPEAAEFTFSIHETGSVLANSLPHALDKPCNRFKEEIGISL